MNTIQKLVLARKLEPMLKERREFLNYLRNEYQPGEMPSSYDCDELAHLNLKIRNIKTKLKED